MGQEHISAQLLGDRTASLRNGVPVNQLAHRSGQCKDIHTIIIRLHHVPFIDVSAIDSLRFFVASLKEKNVNVIFCEANELVCFRMKKSRLDDACHDNLFSKSLSEAIETLQHVKA